MRPQAPVGLDGMARSSSLVDVGERTAFGQCQCRTNLGGRGKEEGLAISKQAESCVPDRPARNMKGGRSRGRKRRRRLGRRHLRAETDGCPWIFVI